MQETEMQDTLDEVQQIWKMKHTHDKTLYQIKWKMHDLAEAQFAPAIDFFLACLEDPEWDWREVAVEHLGFHYQFSPDSAIAERIRQVLRTDPYAEVRMVAASVLGGRSTWPDPVLVTALETDEDEDVREVAFQSLLELAGLPLPQVWELTEQAKHGEIPLTLAEVERLRANAGT